MAPAVKDSYLDMYEKVSLNKVDRMSEVILDVKKYWLVSTDWLGISNQESFTLTYPELATKLE